MSTQLLENFPPSQFLFLKILQMLSNMEDLECWGGKAYPIAKLVLLAFY